jgi:uncharacterized repeat protein (TIGR01451 family)
MRTTFQADLKVTITDGRSRYVAGQNLIYTIMVTNAGPSDVTEAVICESLPETFSGVTLHRDQARWGFKSCAELRKRMLLQRFHLRFDSKKLPLAREMYESDARLRAPGLRKEQDSILRSRISLDVAPRF